MIPMLLIVGEGLLLSLDVLLEHISVAVVVSVHILLHYGISNAIIMVYDSWVAIRTQTSERRIKYESSL
jgi:hypothetical protein